MEPKKRTAAAKTAAAGAAAGEPSEPAKKKISCDWDGSTVTEDELIALAHNGLIPRKEEVDWRAPDPREIRPAPRENEFVVFVENVNHGFFPPGDNFFRDLMRYYRLCPHDLAPNSILHASAFKFACEAFLGCPPFLPLWLELFHCKR